MPKVVIVQVIYNTKKFIEPVFGAIFNQTHKNFEVVAVISGNDDGGKELLMQKFPQVKIIDPGYNIGFAKGHNLVFSQFSADFYQLVNPDFIMEPDYVEQILKVFQDEKIGAATGKLYQFKDLRFKIEDFRSNKILDTTGVTIGKSGRARDRGQHEEDRGQYDKSTNIQAVSAAGAMYRASALQATSYKLQTRVEFFDEDFHSYWEDVDLAWRMSNAGWQCKFAPLAVGYHGRGAGSSKNGYMDVAGFVKHHKTLSPRIRQLNYQNHILMYVKNSPWFYPQFFVREFFMLGYILLFEISTLKVLPQMLRLLPRIWEKRKLIIDSTHSRP
ncbi:MAG: glycosyltransferase [Candidatus Doudnabacteria bacterium]|nr:glycosyltransferase [Candidatus Doudnabacteria bacterium]